MGNKLKYIKETNSKKQKLKMVIATDFSKIFEPIFEPMFDFDQVQSNKINGARPFQTLRCEKTCINSENGTWEKSFSLEMLPTKVEDLKVKVEEGKLNITGTSEIETKSDGFEIKSKHDWTRTIDIPDFVDPKHIKIKLSERLNLLKISANNEETKDIEIMIE